jgi:uncharacterized membrane protein YphA (DoxX/SURF4 family)
MKKILVLIKRFINNKNTLMITRFILAAILLLAAIGKIPEIAKFVDVVSSRGLLPWSLAKVYGSILPWLELILGILFALGLFSRITAGTSILMIFSFIIANGTAVYTNSSLECNCFGFEYWGTGYLQFVKTSDALGIDIVMTLMALAILFYGGGRWNLDSVILPKLRKLIRNIHNKRSE